MESISDNSTAVPPLSPVPESSAESGVHAAGVADESSDADDNPAPQPPLQHDDVLRAYCAELENPDERRVYSVAASDSTQRILFEHEAIDIDDAETLMAMFARPVSDWVATGGSHGAVDLFELASIALGVFAFHCVSGGGASDRLTAALSPQDADYAGDNDADAAEADGDSDGDNDTDAQGRALFPLGITAIHTVLSRLHTVGRNRHTMSAFTADADTQLRTTLRTLAAIADWEFGVEDNVATVPRCASQQSRVKPSLRLRFRAEVVAWLIEWDHVRGILTAWGLQDTGLGSFDDATESAFAEDAWLAQLDTERTTSRSDLYTRNATNLVIELLAPCGVVATYKRVFPFSAHEITIQSMLSKLTVPSDIATIFTRCTREYAGRDTWIAPQPRVPLDPVRDAMDTLGHVASAGLQHAAMRSTHDTVSAPTTSASQWQVRVAGLRTRAAAAVALERSRPTAESLARSRIAATSRVTGSVPVVATSVPVSLQSRRKRTHAESESNSALDGADSDADAPDEGDEDEEEDDDDDYAAASRSAHRAANTATATSGARNMSTGDDTDTAPLPEWARLATEDAWQLAAWLIVLDRRLAALGVMATGGSGAVTGAARARFFFRTLDATAHARTDGVPIAGGLTPLPVIWYPCPGVTVVRCHTCAATAQFKRARLAVRFWVRHVRECYASADEFGRILLETE